MTLYRNVECGTVAIGQSFTLSSKTTVLLDDFRSKETYIWCSISTILNQ